MAIGLKQAGMGVTAPLNSGRAVITSTEDILPLDAFEFTPPNRLNNEKADIKLSLKEGWKFDADSIILKSNRQSLNDVLDTNALVIEENTNTITSLDGNISIVSKTVYDNGVETEASLTLVSNRVTVTEDDLISIGAEAAIAAGITLKGTDDKVEAIGDQLSAIADDGTISIAENPIVKAEWDSIVAEYPILISVAELYSLDIAPNDTEYNAYVVAYANLDNYLNVTLDLFAEPIADVSVTPATWDGFWDAYYNTRLNLNLAISEATFSLANTAQVAADAAQAELDDIALDSEVTPNEKLTVRREWEAIVAEKPDLVAKAVAFAPDADTEKIAYIAAYDALNTYITPLIANVTIKSTIVRATWDGHFTLYYDTRSELYTQLSNVARIEAEAANAELVLVATALEDPDNPGNFINVSAGFDLRAEIFAGPGQTNPINGAYIIGGVNSGDKSELTFKADVIELGTNPTDPNLGAALSIVDGDVYISGTLSGVDGIFSGTLSAVTGDLENITISNNITIGSVASLNIAVTNVGDRATHFFFSADASYRRIYYFVCPLTGTVKVYQNPGLGDLVVSRRLKTVNTGWVTYTTYTASGVGVFHDLIVSDEYNYKFSGSQTTSPTTIFVYGTTSDFGRLLTQMGFSIESTQ